jgi:hypothetical protein
MASKKPKERTEPRRRRGIKPLYVLIPMALMLLSGGAWLLAAPASSPGGPPPELDEEPSLVLNEEPAPAFSEGPRLVFDEASFDFGTVPLDTVVEHSFVYRNAGDEPLVLQDNLEIEAVEGC